VVGKAAVMKMKMKMKMKMSFGSKVRDGVPCLTKTLVT
jgi:hypothetical protein